MTLGVNDRASQPGNALVVNNMVVKVSRVDTGQTAATTEDVAFETMTSESADLFKGEKKVTQAGAAGKVERASSSCWWTAAKPHAPWFPRPFPSSP